MFNRGKNFRTVRTSRDTGFFRGMPLFFKLWFGFVFTVVMAIFAVVGYSLFAIASDPDAHARYVGRLVGEVVAGYNEAAGE
jgi:hypothetical protein